MAQAVSRRPLSAESWFRFRVSPCGVSGGQSGTRTVFSPLLRFCCVVSFHQCCTLTFTYAMLLPDGQTGQARQTFKSKARSETGERWIEKYFHSLLGYWNFSWQFLMVGFSNVNTNPSGVLPTDELTDWPQESGGNFAPCAPLMKKTRRRNYLSP
jgi:hypothetical protein